MRAMGLVLLLARMCSKGLNRMNIQELLEMADDHHVDIYLHLPECEGQRLIMVGGAITTQERYDAFEISLCHLSPDGVIRRYLCEIGTACDIELIVDDANER
jgi:hypothetical protein